MRIAVSSKDKNMTSLVDPRFGRARYFIIFDTSDGTFEVLDNEENARAAQGAGVQSAETVVSKNVDLVISGSVGPKAFDTLSAAGIKAIVWEGGTVSEAVEMVKSDQLKPADGANVEGHWK